MWFGLYSTGRKGKHQWYVGIVRKFQWVGIMFSTDDPVIGERYFLFEFRLLWFRMWYTYEF